MRGRRPEHAQHQEARGLQPAAIAESALPQPYGQSRTVPLFLRACRLRVCVCCGPSCGDGGGQGSAGAEERHGVVRHEQVLRAHRGAVGDVRGDARHAAQRGVLLSRDARRITHRL